MLHEDAGDGGGLRINRSRTMGLPLIARLDPDMFDDEGNMVRDNRYDFDDNDYAQRDVNSCLRRSLDFFGRISSTCCE